MTPLDREALLHTLITGGGALLLAYASYLWRTERAAQQQARGLAACGVGFLMTAGASIYLRERPLLGAAISIAGSVIAVVGMRVVLRDRIERQGAARRESGRGQ